MDSMGALFAGIVRASMTSVRMIFEMTAVFAGIGRKIGQFKTCRLYDGRQGGVGWVVIVEGWKDTESVYAPST